MSKPKLTRELEAVEKVIQNMEIKKSVLLNQAMNSTHPSDIIKAATIVENVEQRNRSQKKSYIVDPYEFNNSFGYKNKSYSMSFEMLKRTSFNVPIIRAIIGTRIDQMAAFSEPQSDKYSTGFLIRKKQPYYNKETKQATREEIAKANKMTDFILNCGMGNSYTNDDFDTFNRKIDNDSFTYDQMTFEIVNDRRGKPYEFMATDASTMRIADSYDDDSYKRQDREEVKGYLPSYCQILDGVVNADFYPWEMCFGVRNPTSNIYSNGYGVSEIEILINVITSMLWSDEYNRRFFSQGSSPKGFFKFKTETDANNSRIQDFKQQFQGMISGVYNSWKTPVLQGDVDWVDLHKSNQDMEFSKWQEYLIKLACAIYSIDPAEINFPLSGGANDKPMFEGNNEARLKHSKDKGLYPALKFKQRRFNKMLISRIDPEYEFVYVGMDGIDQVTELEQDIKLMNFMTVDEIRVKRGLKPLGEENGGNTIANSIVYQTMNAKEMREQQEKMMSQNVGQQEGNEQGQEDFNPDEDENYDENPFEKAFDSYIESLNKSDNSAIKIK